MQSVLILIDIDRRVNYLVLSNYICCYYKMASHVTKVGEISFFDMLRVEVGSDFISNESR